MESQDSKFPPALVEGSGTPESSALVSLTAALATLASKVDLLMSERASKKRPRLSQSSDSELDMVATDSVPPEGS